MNATKDTISTYEFFKELTALLTKYTGIRNRSQGLSQVEADLARLENTGFAIKNMYEEVPERTYSFDRSGYVNREPRTIKYTVYLEGW